MVITSQTETSNTKMRETKLEMDPERNFTSRVAALEGVSRVEMKEEEAHIGTSWPQINVR